MRTVGTVITTYNGERFLDEQLKSILQQTQRPQQIVIVDDCSQDGTKKIIDKYVKEFPKLFTFIQNKKNLGPKSTFEIGISKCETDYIALCDQDDIWEPNKIAKLFQDLENNEKAKLCFHNLKFINENGNLIKDTDYWKVAPLHEPLPVTGAQARERLANFSNPVPGCTMFFSFELKPYILPMPTSKWIGHDWWISVNGFFFADPIFIEDALTWYRLHSNQTAGIGTILNKKKINKNKSPLYSRLAREIKRIFSHNKARKTKLLAMKESSHAMSVELLEVIKKCERMNLNPKMVAEYQLLKNRISKNIKN